MTSADGYLRLPLKTLHAVPLRHLISDIDDEAPDAACGSASIISGYTEWVSATEPAVSLGWDWSLECSNGHVRCVRNGLPRTNVMVVDEEFRDYGWERSLDLLAGVVDQLGWSEQTHKMVTERYDS
ncbi:MAG: DUF4902 domain-containing protein [Variovorax sp.]